MEAAAQMSSCCSSFFAANEHQFSDAVARRDLTRYYPRRVPCCAGSIPARFIMRCGNGELHPIRLRARGL